jgi:hypothetical protein
VQVAEYRDEDFPNCRGTHATLFIQHADLEPEELTKRFGVQPTHSFRKGEKNNKWGVVIELGSWSFSTKAAIDSRDLRRHLDWLIDQFAGTENVFAELRAGGYSLRVVCNWEAEGFADGPGYFGGPSLSSRNRQGLAGLSLDIRFNFSCMDIL